MSEHVIFCADDTKNEVGKVEISDAWEQSVPVVDLTIAQELGRTMVYGVETPVAVQPGRDGMPGRYPTAIPSTNTRSFSEFRR
ncbi:MAG: hypothetical protein ABIR37_04385 [Candidatus Saccharimonadales bacterium]